MQSIISSALFQLCVIPALVICLTSTTYVISSDNYAFSYSFGDVHRKEERKGNVVRGEYSYLTPNGRVQFVRYEVDGQKGFRAAVTYRQPGGQHLKGHLQFPRYYRKPIQLAQPVGLITPDLLYGRRIS